MSQIKSIAELLPEGLSEETVTHIAELVDGVIKEEVNQRVKLLEAKVKGFLRMEIQSIKEHALKELQEESEVYRNAQLFESIKSLMALELNEKDETRAVAKAVKEQSEVEEENQVLIEELNNAVKQVQQLERTIKVLSKKNKTLEEQTVHLESAITELTEQNDLDFKSSEKAVIIADEMKNTPVKKESKVNNQFLTESVMALMPRTK
jgi:DNA repair exonuclease SbcCD ATPase subunit